MLDYDDGIFIHLLVHLIFYSIAGQAQHKIMNNVIAVPVPLDVQKLSLKSCLVLMAPCNPKRKPEEVSLCAKTNPIPQDIKSKRKNNANVINSGTAICL